MTAHISERGTLDAEYYRLLPERRRAYAGYKTWYDLHRHQPLRARRALEALQGEAGPLRSRPARHRPSENVSKPVRKRFAIVR